MKSIDNAEMEAIMLIRLERNQFHWIKCSIFLCYSLFECFYFLNLKSGNF